VGQDPIHPTNAAYRELAAKIAEKTEQLLVERSTRENHPETKSEKLILESPEVEFINVFFTA
jgi:hypothetical protein